MNRACIAIVDGTSARLYAYQRVDEDLPTLVEEKRLSDAGRGTKDAQFANEVVSELETIATSQGFDHVILVASPTMLAHLHTYETRLTRHGIRVDEVLRDLTRLTSPQIHDHLASLNVIEPRKRAAAAQR
ncbi:MAG: hypothetical protein JWP01_2497 [Myxococcales bacterium]|nr:hypothetical protein [Myxococcales bacterium]